MSPNAIQELRAEEGGGLIIHHGLIIRTIWYLQGSKAALKNSGIVDDDTANLIGGAVDMVENQAEAGRDATVADRLKMAGEVLFSYNYIVQRQIMAMQKG